MEWRDYHGTTGALLIKINFIYLKQNDLPAAWLSYISSPLAVSYKDQLTTKRIGMRNKLTNSVSQNERKTTR